MSCWSGYTRDFHRFELPERLPAVRSIAIGRGPAPAPASACALTHDGILRCTCGLYRAGNYVQIALGGSSIYAVTADGRIDRAPDCSSVSGALSAGPFGAFSEIATGKYDDCGIRANSRVQCWGRFAGSAMQPTGYGARAIAVGEGLAFAQVSSQLQTWNGIESPGTWRTFIPFFSPVEATAGAAGVCALDAAGTLECGDHWWFQIREPIPFVLFPYGVPLHGIVGAWQHVCALTPEGNAVCQGLDEFGESSPPGGAFTSLGVGDRHGCGVRPDGSLACWGDDSHGQSSPPPGSYVAVGAGRQHSCAIRSDGTLACFGDDSARQLRAPPGVFETVRGSGYHTCALRRDRSMVCWGARVR